MVSVEDQIIARVQAALADISVANGFETNVARVYLPETSNTEDITDLPACVIVTEGSTKDDGRVGMIIETLNLSVHAVIKITDPTNWVSILNSFSADVDRKLREDWTWGGIAQDTHVTESDTPSTDQHEERAASRTAVNIVFRYAYDDPSQPL